MILALIIFNLSLKIRVSTLKMLRPSENLTLSILVFCSFQLIEIKWVNCRDWARTRSLSEKIVSDFATMDREELFFHLHQVRRTVGWASMADLIPAGFTGEQKQMVASVLALARLTWINYDKCIEPFRSTDKGNPHRDNFIGLVPTVKRFFGHSASTLEIIESYHQNQLFLCKNALNTSIKSHVSRKSTFHKRDYDNFLGPFLSSFPHETPVEQLTKADLSLGIARFMMIRLNAPALSRVTSTWPALAEEFNIRLIGNCRLYLLDPLKTMMSTLEIIGRSNVPNIVRNDRQLIRAYDLCIRLKSMSGAAGMSESMNVIRVMTQSQ